MPRGSEQRRDFFPPIARFSVDPHRQISEMADLGTKTAMQRHRMSSYRRTGALISLQGSFLLRISALYRPYSRIPSSTDPNGRPWPWAESGPNEAIGRNRQNGPSDPTNGHRSGSWSLANQNQPTAGLYWPYRALNGISGGPRGQKWRFWRFSWL